MGSFWSVATGLFLLVAVGYIADGWKQEEAATQDGGWDGRCTDERGALDPPEGMVVGGPMDNTDEEPYRSFMRKCGSLQRDAEAAPTVDYGGTR